MPARAGSSRLRAAALVSIEYARTPNAHRPSMGAIKLGEGYERVSKSNRSEPEILFPPWQRGELEVL